MARKKSANVESEVSLVPVEDNRDLARDMSSNAIINTNKKAYLKAVQEKSRRMQEKSEIDSLKSEVSELKSMLAQILEKVGGNVNN
jgi:hypothetical protein